MVLGHFGLWAWPVCRILADSCSGISRVSRVRVKVRLMDQCVKGLKCLRTKVTIHQFRLIYPTIIARVQCMYASYVIWDGGSGGLVVTF